MKNSSNEFTADSIQPDILDPRHLAELTLLETQRPGFCRMFHERFRESFSQGCTEMIEALHSNQRQTQIDLAHRLSGSAASFGATGLAGRFREFEKRLAAGERVSSEQIEALCGQAREVDQAFLNWLETCHT